MYKVVFVRHGQSEWNRDNRFTGWIDVDLTELGEEQARDAGKVLREKGFVFDVAYTSVLKRATKTLDIVLDEMGLAEIPVHNSWRLNERMYGDLQGKGKKEMTEELGEEQIFIWRRSYDVAPPAVTKEDSRWPGNDALYGNVDKELLPVTESTEDALGRILPVWLEDIVPAIKSGKNVISVSHGTSIRSIVSHLEGMTKEEVSQLNIPCGFPLVYELDENMKPIKHYYLGDEEKLKCAVDGVKNEAVSK